MESMFCEIFKPTPVFNHPDFQYIFGGNQENKLLTLHLEFIALPQMECIFVNEITPSIIQVQFPAYPKGPLYIDRRFIKFIKTFKTEIIQFPSKNQILEKMKKRLGTPYLWGGNFADGVEELASYYPSSFPLDQKNKDLWTLKGLDCSGLLFEAANGQTPRNTSELIYFGQPVHFNHLEPLDLIVYPGHVFFVFNHETVIESRSPFGVILDSLEKRMEEIQKTRSFISNWNSKINKNQHFTIRRIEFK